MENRITPNERLGALCGIACSALAHSLLERVGIPAPWPLVISLPLLAVLYYAGFMLGTYLDACRCGD